MGRISFKIDFENTGQSDPARLELRVFSGYNTSREGRIYLDGDTPPAYTNFGSGVLSLGGVIAEGLYVVEFKDADGEVVLAKVNIYDFANSCFNYDNTAAYDEQGSYGYIQVGDTGLFFSSTIRYSSINPTFDVGRNRSASIDSEVTNKAITEPSGPVSWSNAELGSLGYTTEVPQLSLRRNILPTSHPLYHCTTVPAIEILLDRVEYDDLGATFNKTDATAVDAADGTITVAVTGGSGSFSYLWNDGATTQNRSALDVGTYSVVVTDDVTSLTVELTDIVINEPQPAPEVVEGTLLEFSPLNDLQFVVNPVTEPDDCDTFQQLDNVLLINQKHGAYERTNYFNKINICDTRNYQFNSDFTSHLVELRDYVTDELIKLFTATLKEENIGVSEDHAIRLTDHDVADQTRVYFQIGNVPIPLEVGQTFQIMNNGEGMNGVFSIIDIGYDTLLSYSYLVINLTYLGAGSSSNADGRFISNAADFNVFEIAADYSDVDAGCYYIKVTATTVGGSTTFTAKSEPMSVKVKHKNTVLIEYRSFDNSMDITWTTGIIFKIRVEGVVGHKRLPGGEITVSRDADYAISQTAAKMTRGNLFQTGMLPPYMHEKMSYIFACDYKSINGLEVKTSEGYAEPEYRDRLLLAQSSIKIESRAFRRYNSDDIGTVNDGGFIATETGFLKQ